MRGDLKNWICKDKKRQMLKLPVKSDKSINEHNRLCDQELESRNIQAHQMPMSSNDL